MNSAVIIDVIVAALLIAAVIAGARRGLFRTLAGLVIVVVALVGAGLLADLFTAPVTRVVQPAIVAHFEKKIDQAVTEPELTPPETDQTETDEPEEEDSAPQELLDKLEAGRLLQALGVDEKLSGSLAQQAQETVHDTGMSIASAVAQAMAESVIHAVLFVVFFLLLLIVLNLAAKAMDLLLKMPGLHFCNRLGGAAVGLLEGALLLFLAIWALRRLGVSFETDTVNATYLLSFFARRSPLDLLTFL